MSQQLAGERDEGGTVEMRLRDTGHEIRRAWPERRDAHPGDAARARHRLCHERSRGLVPRQHELEAGLTKALDEIDHLAAGMTEGVAHARGAQPRAQ